MRIDVTEEDIARGESCSSSNCPLARAITRAMGQPVFVDGQYAILGISGRKTALPEDAAEFADRIDAGLYPAPISFHLRWEE